MRGALRRSSIMDRIRRDGAAAVGELARDLDVSPATIHRDLRSLAEEGLVERVHGGARLPDSERATRTAWASRRSRNAAAKAQIAQKALEWIEDGSTVFIDASTTCAALATALAASPVRSLTLVTNSPAIAAEFDHDGVHLIVAPGEVDQNLRMIGGRWTVEFLGGLNFETSFISAIGITPDAGLSTAQRNISDVLRAVHRASKQTLALVDSSKYGIQSLLPVLTVDELDTVIMDGDLPEPARADLRGAGAELVIAGEGAIRTS
ncbi:MAG TPA: DeoR/GlpR family DNA-binding transcription regulator [Solirubrobacterales bacterium]|nr:DeoR/GlpR family DNA-binding transcription regulator [Solirubrobacterales bacterium]